VFVADLVLFFILQPTSTTLVIRCPSQR